MIGGISLSERKDAEKYFDYMIEEHKKSNPKLVVLEKYIGVKNEIISMGENRNYIFHINKEVKYKFLVYNTWKIYLAFSIAPEFYRIIYNKP